MCLVALTLEPCLTLASISCCLVRLPQLASRTSMLEEQRHELTMAEERNERMRRELLTIESTGGGDSAEQ